MSWATKCTIIMREDALRTCKQARRSIARLKGLHRMDLWRYRMVILERWDSPIAAPRIMVTVNYDLSSTAKVLWSNLVTTAYVWISAAPHCHCSG